MGGRNGAAKSFDKSKCEAGATCKREPGACVGARAHLSPGSGPSCLTSASYVVRLSRGLARRIEPFVDL